MNQSQVWNMRVSFNNISYGLGRFCSAHSARSRAYKFILFMKDHSHFLIMFFGESNLGSHD